MDIWHEFNERAHPRDRLWDGFAYGVLATLATLAGAFLLAVAAGWVR